MYLIFRTIKSIFKMQNNNQIGFWPREILNCIVAYSFEMGNAEGKKLWKLLLMQILVNKIPGDILLMIRKKKKNNELFLTFCLVICKFLLK